MKKSISKKTIVYAHPVFIVGSYNKDMRPNIMAASWGGICCSQPPSIAVSLRKSRYTYDNIMLHKAFTVCIPSEKYIRETDFSGINSGKDMNKFEILGLTAVHGKIVEAPYIEEFPMVLLCRLEKTVEIGVHTQFIGEILDSLVDEEYLNEKGLPIIEKINPFIYDSSSGFYYGIGERLLEAYTQKKIMK